MSLLNPIQVQGYFPPEQSNAFKVGQYKLNKVKVMNPFLNLKREDLLVSTKPHLPQNIADMLLAEKMARPQVDELPVGTESRMNVQDLLDQDNVVKARSMYKNAMNRIRDSVLTAQQKVKQEEELLLELSARFPPRVVREAVQQSRSPDNPADVPARRQPARSEGTRQRNMVDRLGLMVRDSFPMGKADGDFPQMVGSVGSASFNPAMSTGSSVLRRIGLPARGPQAYVPGKTGRMSTADPMASASAGPRPAPMPPGQGSPGFPTLSSLGPSPPKQSRSPLPATSRFPIGRGRGRGSTVDDNNRYIPPGMTRSGRPSRPPRRFK